MQDLNWRKSSYSGGGADTCVELADLREKVAIRDSKNPRIAPLSITRRQLSRLTSRIRTGELG